jgi:hypothetical protein
MTQFKPAKLSSQGLARLPFHHYANDFQFIVDRNSYSCPSFVADFLAPIVGQLHANDPTANLYIIATKDELDLFPKFLSLGYGAALEITQQSFPFYSAVSDELQNIELSKYLSAYLHYDEESGPETVLERYLLRKRLDLDISPEILFLASHFHELSDRVLLVLDAQDLSLIAASPSLKLKSEDSLFDLISSRVRLDPG